MTETKAEAAQQGRECGWSRRKMEGVKGSGQHRLVGPSFCGDEGPRVCSEPGTFRAGLIYRTSSPNIIDPTPHLIFR